MVLVERKGEGGYEDKLGDKANKQGEKEKEKLRSTFPHDAIGVHSNRSLTCMSRDSRSDK